MCVVFAVPVAAYQWLVCFLLEKSQRRLEQQKAAGLDDFDARNNSQVKSWRAKQTQDYGSHEIPQQLARPRYHCSLLQMFHTVLMEVTSSWTMKPN